MKPIQVGGTLVIIIIRLSTFLPFSMADKVPDLQKSEMMSVRLPYNEDRVNFLRFIPPFSYRVFTAKGLFNFYLINVWRFNYIISPDFLWIFLIILAVNFYLSMTKVSYLLVFFVIIDSLTWRWPSGLWPLVMSDNIEWSMEENLCQNNCIVVEIPLF